MKALQKTQVNDVELYEGVLMVEDIFVPKGVLVDLRFIPGAIEMITPSTRMVRFLVRPLFRCSRNLCLENANNTAAL